MIKSKKKVLEITWIDTIPIYIGILLMIIIWFILPHTTKAAIQNGYTASGAGTVGVNGLYCPTGNPYEWFNGNNYISRNHDNNYLSLDGQPNYWDWGLYNTHPITGTNVMVVWGVQYGVSPAPTFATSTGACGEPDATTSPYQIRTSANQIQENIYHGFILFFIVATLIVAYFAYKFKK